MSSERQEIYSAFSGDIHAVVGKNGDVLREFIFCIDNGEVVVPMLSCQVTFEDLSVSGCIEYCFAEEPSKWHLAQVSLEAIEDFQQNKFRLWEHQLKEPECEAAFRRQLQQGPIRHVYDKIIFPTPERIARAYKVIDEHSGKVVDLPHQVERMRMWNAEKQDYDELDPKLNGAPKDEESAKKYWVELLDRLRELRGVEYIDSLLG